MFSFISQNWRGRPLVDRATVVNCIAKTQTKTGLTIKAILDENSYPKGIKISDEEMAKVRNGEEALCYSYDTFSNALQTKLTCFIFTENFLNVWKKSFLQRIKRS